jgi:pimeloyl-ACP methyl ester carboxylesterase
MGLKIYYQKLGKGHPLILLHGHHQDGGIFDKLVAPLSLYYTVVVPDMRGHGLSEGEASEHYQTEVEDLRAFISALKLRKAIYLRLWFRRFSSSFFGRPSTRVSF